MDLDRVIAQLPETIEFVIDAHANHARTPIAAVRRHDSKTPYWVHPLWCMSMCLQEVTLPVETRITGSQALAFHDVEEDTSLKVPQWAVPEVRGLVMHMTFQSTEEEEEQIWFKPEIVQLLKLYDKVSNLLDASWMTLERRERYETYTLSLLEAVEEEFGRGLNITKFARTIIRPSLV